MCPMEIRCDGVGVGNGERRGAVMVVVEVRGDGTRKRE